MVYSLRRGVENEHIDNTQKGLLVGLPAIALALSFGAVHHPGVKPPAGTAAKTIPVVASLNSGPGSPGGGTSAGGQGGSASSSGSVRYSTSAAAGGSGESGSSASGSATGTGSTGGSGTGTVGGKGGGPTGGSGGGGTGGGSTLPTCSLDQVATVNCQVSACTPAITLAPGQKAILGLNGTCLVIN